MPTSPTPIAALPTPPSTANPAGFDSAADAFLGALPTFRTETNTVAANVYNNAVEAAGSASAASGSASTASTHATNAGNSASAAAASALAAANTVATIPEGAINDLTTSLANVWSSSKTNSMLSSATPAGAIIYYAANTPPTGFLKANGAAVSRTTYAALFAAIGVVFGEGDGSTTFTLPDLRGYFQRGWDDARGIDSGRAFGNTQADANLSHNHTGTANSGGSHSHTFDFVAHNTGYMSVTAFGGTQSGTTTTSTDGDHTHTLTINSNGGTESRPKNISLLACIKY